MSHTKSPRIKIKEQEEIYRLKTSLTTLEARTSHLHVRLLETLNTLDYIQSVHSEELDTLAREKFELEQKLRMLQLQLDEVTDERDDMRDAVERLVEKVELANGFHFLPHSAIHIHQLLEPRPVSRRETSRPGTPGLYMPSLIKTLTADLAEEKKYHQKTRKDADTQIALLRAQVARREIELETYILTGNNASQNVDEPPRSLPHLTKNDALLILGQANERNRALQKEVEELGRQLEDARLESSFSSGASGSPDGGDLMGATKVQPPSPILIGKADQAPASIPSTPIGRSTPDSHSPSEDVFSSNPVPPHKPNPSATSRIPAVFLPETPPVPQRISAPLSLSQPLSAPLQGVFADIEDQISAGTMDVEELNTEREHLDLFSSCSNSMEENTSIAEMESIWLLEEECIRLRASNRDALKNVTQAAARETELREAICNLEERLRRRNFYELHGQGSDSSEFDSDGGTIAPRRRRDAASQYREDTSTDDEDYGYRTSPTVSEGQEHTHSSITQDLEPSSNVDVSESWVSSAHLEHESESRILSLEAALRIAREEIDRKDEELRTLRATMQRAVSQNGHRDDGVPVRQPLISRRTN